MTTAPHSQITPLAPTSESHQWITPLVHEVHKLACNYFWEESSNNQRTLNLSHQIQIHEYVHQCKAGYSITPYTFVTVQLILMSTKAFPGQTSYVFLGFYPRVSSGSTCQENLPSHPGQILTALQKAAFNVKEQKLYCRPLTQSLRTTVTLACLGSLYQRFHSCVYCPELNVQNMAICVYSPSVYLAPSRFPS